MERQLAVTVAILTLAIPLLAISWGSAWFNRKDRQSDDFTGPVVGAAGSAAAIAMSIATLLHIVPLTRIRDTLGSLSGMSLAHESSALILGAFSIAFTEWSIWSVVLDLRRGRQPRPWPVGTMAAVGTVLALLALSRT